MTNPTTTRATLLADFQTVHALVATDTRAVTPTNTFVGSLPEEGQPLLPKTQKRLEAALAKLWKLASPSAAAEAQAAVAAVTLPTQAQLDAEEAACRAEEAANLEAERIALEAEAAAKPVTEGYDGPMLALRQRAKLGLYTKAANGQLCCADQLATALGVLPPEGVIQACLLALNLPTNPYTKLNIGQQSMNLRNKLRHALKSGVFGFGVVTEAVEDVQAALEEQAAINANRV